jgi:UPF0716 protein FxsA
MGGPGRNGPVFAEIIWLRRWPRLVSTCFIVLILLEILAFVWVADQIGLGLTLLALIGSAVVGLWLIRRTGLDMVARLRMVLAQGQEPGHSLVDGVCFVIAGLLLILPGFFSDLIAVLLMLPITRNWLIRHFASKIVGAAAAGAATSAGKGPRAGKIISDVEFREVNTPAANAPVAEPGAPATPEGTPASEAPVIAPAEVVAAEPEIFAPTRPSPTEAAGSPSEMIEAVPVAENPAGDTPASETPDGDERWGRAPRRPIIDVEES